MWNGAEKCFEAIGYLGPSMKDYRHMKCLFALRWCEWVDLDKERVRTENMKHLIQGPRHNVKGGGSYSYIPVHIPSKQKKFFRLQKKSVR